MPKWEIGHFTVLAMKLTHELIFLIMVILIQQYFVKKHYGCLINVFHQISVWYVIFRMIQQIIDIIFAFNDLSELPVVRITILLFIAPPFLKICSFKVCS